MRIDRRIADENVDAAPSLAGLGDEAFELRFVRDACRLRDRLTALRADRCCDLLAGCEVARGDYDPAAGLGERLGDRPADAAARPGHDRDLPRQIEQIHRAL